MSVAGVALAQRTGEGQVAVDGPGLQRPASDQYAATICGFRVPEGTAGQIVAPGGNG